MNDQFLLVEFYRC